MCDRITVTEQLRADPADCDLIVGTEEEIMIAGGADDTLGAIRRHPRALAGDHRAEARRDGLHRL